MESLVYYDACLEGSNAIQYAKEASTALGYFRSLDDLRQSFFVNKTDKKFKITITIEEIKNDN
jgi:hypothetical protein